MSTIAYSGKLSLEKGVHCLLAAMPMIAERAPGAQLVLMGSGVADTYFKGMLAALGEGDLEEAARNMEEAAIDPYEQAWTTQVRSYWEQQRPGYLDAARTAGLESRVTFAGLLPLKGIAEKLPMMDVQVIPSIVKEAFPLVSLEALAAGVPPLGPYRGGLAPILDQAAEALGSLGSLLRWIRGWSFLPFPVSRSLTRSDSGLLRRLVPRNLKGWLRRIARLSLQLSVSRLSGWARSMSAKASNGCGRSAFCVLYDMATSIFSERGP